VGFIVGTVQKHSHFGQCSTGNWSQAQGGELRGGFRLEWRRECGYVGEWALGERSNCLTTRLKGTVRDRGASKKTRKEDGDRTEGRLGRRGGGSDKGSTHIAFLLTAFCGEAKENHILTGATKRASKNKNDDIKVRTSSLGGKKPFVSVQANVG